MTYLEQIALATDLTFIHRLQQAAVKAAAAIMNEAANTPGHAQRVAYAAQVLREPQGRARELAYGAVTQEGMSPEAPDAALDGAVSALWNAYAGYSL